MKVRKYNYELVIQMDYGQGFEDMEVFETASNFALNREQRAEYKNCRDNYKFMSPSVPFRTIRRRTKNDV